MNDTKLPSDRTTQAAEPRVSPRNPEGDSRDWSDRRASAQALRAAQARQASGRRRLVDPATCDRDYSVEELEFMQAMQRYKQESGRMFPTWSEVLEVLLGLGYEKVAPPVVESQSPLDAIGPSRRVASA